MDNTAFVTDIAEETTTPETAVRSKGELSSVKEEVELQEEGQDK